MRAARDRCVDAMELPADVARVVRLGSEVQLARLLMDAAMGAHHGSPVGSTNHAGLWISDTAVADGTRMRARGSRVAPGADQRGLIAEAQRLAEQLPDRAEAMRRAPAPRRTAATAACRART